MVKRLNASFRWHAAFLKFMIYSSKLNHADDQLNDVAFYLAFICLRIDVKRAIFSTQKKTLSIATEGFGIKVWR